MMTLCGWRVLMRDGKSYTSTGSRCHFASMRKAYCAVGRAKLIHRLVVRLHKQDLIQSLVLPLREM
jgi:hypothetical protein